MRRTTASCWKSFSPKIATSGRTMLNSLATTVATPTKWPGRTLAAQALATARAPRRSVWKPGGYMAAGVGHEGDVDAGRGRLGQVALEVARVLGEILLGAELGRVDEDRQHQAVAAAPALLHQRDVAGVQGAHGGHEGRSLDRAARCLRRTRSAIILGPSRMTVGVVGASFT